MQRIARLARLALGLNVVVILGGALVRASGSGAGCGRSWPVCHGQIVPAEIEGALAIEYAHRLLSGVALITVGVLFVMVRRTVDGQSKRARQLRLAAMWSIVAIMGEALIGAGIVLFEWVNQDSSIARTVAVPLHLVNTFILLGALALTVSLASWGRPLRWRQSPYHRQLSWGIGLMVLVAATGAVTALADTLFPKDSVGFDGLGATETFLTDLRIVHPLLATVAGLVIVRIVAARPATATTRAARLGRLVAGIVGLQILAGLLNVALLVPIWMQLVHLALADTLWIVFIWFAQELQPLTEPVPASSG